MAAAKSKAAADARRMDPSGDGKVDRAAFKADGGSDADFDRYDQDNNGTLDQDELEAMAAAKSKAAADARRMDPSGDGKVDRAAFKAGGGSDADFDPVLAASILQQQSMPPPTHAAADLGSRLDHLALYWDVIAS